MSHSGSSHVGIEPKGLTSCPHRFDPAAFSGFSYLLGPPAAAQRSKLGNDPAAAHQLLAALSKALPGAGNYWSAALDGGLTHDDNPGIPSGYTYLLQLVAHDLVQTTVPFWAAAQLGLGSRNMRSSPLLLDTLYGGGPNTAPTAYRMMGYTTADRTHLRIGRFRSATTGMMAQSEECPFRDLARINLDALDYLRGSDDLKACGSLERCRNLDAAKHVQPANFDDPFVTCVADPRSDDNLVLAQLVVLFARAHEAIVAQLTGARPEAMFGYAQLAMQRLYHAIIEHDLLPRLLHPDILASLRDRSANDECWLWRTEGAPLEFTHGVFRIGHAMVRSDYRLNAANALDIGRVLKGDGSWADLHYPLRESWLIEWAQFFDLPGGVTPNFARRFSPTQSALDVAGLFQSNDPEQPASLSLRDMLSAALARTWSVDALIDRMLAHTVNPLPPGWAWCNAGKRRAAIGDWLSTRCKAGELDDAKIEVLAVDPPLPLFVLLEAALDDKIAGRHLGPLGSVIVGEVIGRSIARQRQQLAAAECAARAAFDPEFWSEIEAIKAMPDLIAFVQRQAGCETPPTAGT